MAFIKQFSSLSPSIKNQLVSEASTAILADIHDRINVFGADLALLPRAITRLVTGETPPKQFIATIQEEIGLDFATAQ